MLLLFLRLLVSADRELNRLHTYLQRQRISREEAAIDNAIVFFFLLLPLLLLFLVLVLAPTREFVLLRNLLAMRAGG